MDVLFIILGSLLLILIIAFVILMFNFGKIFCEGTLHLRNPKRKQRKPRKASKNPPPKKVDPVEKDRARIEELRATGEKWLESMNPEIVYIKSFDGLKLGAEFVPAKVEGSKKTFIGVHGYTANGHSDFGVVGQLFYEMGYNLLLVSQRAHRYSEGEYVTFGVYERFDCLNWIKYVNERIGEDGTIFLHGLSMGGATVTMTIGFPDLPKSVKGCISDCALTSGGDMFRMVAKNVLKNTPAKFVPLSVISFFCNLYCKIKLGCGMDDYSTVEAVKNTKVPLLVIHGDKDDCVPLWMGQKNYDECVSEKEILILKGSGHAVNYQFAPEICREKIKAFVEKYE
ncbi:MAG: alpha/beta hydrolase [Ruminococcaceae bacterium]|nr:alpha/beta hydrolase [Oscillospiraceae bacterium]